MIADLLDPLNTNLKIRETQKKGVYVEHLKEDIVMSPDQVFSLLAAGESHRHIGRTNYNEVSSRAHTIFRIVVESTSRSNAADAVRVSALNLVDLAGSENAVKAGSASRIKETGYINKSLLTLGHVIWKLTEKAAEHVMPCHAMPCALCCALLTAPHLTSPHALMKLTLLWGCDVRCADSVSRQ